MLPSICAALVTPITSSYDTDIPKLAAHAMGVLANGCDGVVLFGTTGEAASFGIAQRQATLDGLVELGVPASKIIVGTGCCSIADTALLSRHALGHGCAAVLVHPPYFFRPAEEAGVYRFFAGLAETLGEAARDILFYHFPETTGASISVTVIRDLLQDYSSVFVGVKDSTGVIEHTQELVRQFPELKIYSGDDDLLWPLLAAGGHGAITATANLTPTLLASVKAGWQDNTQIAQEAQIALSGLWNKTLLSYPVSEAVKEIIANISQDDSWRELVPPLSCMPRKQRDQLMRDVAPYMPHFLATT